MPNIVTLKNVASKLGKSANTESDTLNKLLNIEITLRQISKLLRTDNDFEHRLSELCKAISEALKCEAVSICLQVENGWKKVYYAEPVIDIDELAFIMSFEGFSEISQISANGTFIDNLTELPLLTNSINGLSGVLPRSAAIVGIFSKENWHGYISAMDFSPGRKWNSSDEQILISTAEEISLARDRYITLEKLTNANQMVTKKAEELEKALAREIEMNTLQAEFIATASHEFKTPLAIIDSAAQLMKSGNAVDEAYISRQLEKIRGAVKRMGYLVEKTLDLSAVEAGNIGFEPKRMDICPILSEAAKRFMDIYPSRKIIVIHPSTEVLVQVDEKLLDQALSNLIGNALKYSSEQSEISLRLATENGNAAIYICDSGIGICPDDLERMCRKFARGRNTSHTSGTGIGLYISEKFIRMMDGNVWISSELNKGTTVKVTLPLALSNLSGGILKSERSYYAQNTLH